VFNISVQLADCLPRALLGTNGDGKQKHALPSDGASARIGASLREIAQSPAPLPGAPYTR
jgi:hypothetical protein